jgi:hypothetical protein
VAGAITTEPGSAKACNRAARFGVSPTTACSCLRGAFADQVTHHDEPGGDADANLEPADLWRVHSFDRGDDVEASPHGALGIVFVGAPIAEINQYAVASSARMGVVLIRLYGDATKRKFLHAIQISGYATAGIPVFFTTSVETAANCTAILESTTLARVLVTDGGNTYQSIPSVTATSGSTTLTAAPGGTKVNNILIMVESLRSYMSEHASADELNPWKR